MKTYFALFVIATLSALVLTPLLRRLCERFRLLDEPRDSRRVHGRPIPSLGGIAIFLSILIAACALFFVDNALTQRLRPDLRSMVVFLACGFLVLALGVYDDLRGTRAMVKFVWLGAVTALFYALGGRIEGLSIPFLGQINIHPIVGFLLTMVWVVGIANAFNLIDGVDGLATGSALFSSLVLVTVSLIQGKESVAVIALVLTGALAGFLRYNFNPASIFLGDSGSLFVGFSLAALSLQGSQKASTAVAVAIPILAFGLPVVDTSVTIARRFLSGKPIFEGDREHIHHMLLARGWSQRRVVLVLYAVSAAFGLLAMLFVNVGSGLTAVVLFVVGVAITMALGKLRYHEVDELKASVRRNIGDRRVRAVNNLRLRRACQAIESSTTLEQLFSGITEVLELGDFVYATSKLSDGDGAGLNLIDPDGCQNGLRSCDDGVEWSWHRGNNGHSNRDELWEMRLPLADRQRFFGHLNMYRPLQSDALLFDVNYLTTAFQPAVSRAAGRIIEAAREAAPRRRTAAAAAGR